ncbi:PAP2 superfamily protein [Natronorubrum sediminis]|uniref:PAP2 superfamily protein n=1 Tax=Natronorubrum sediminis TaxID=640943 RepID=A0A1H6G1T0_9EURY|nr:phosphatase PAP2 family protein [Natronorubrum sediminis]SEH15954.1 PAP2 superfamily protein [Natronorubrum sediminis]
MRLEDESALIREEVPSSYADLVVAITELGSPTPLLIVLAIVFWWGNRRRSALVISYGVAGLGFILTLETVLGIPRPPEDIMLTSLEVEGYGFPSGHAFASMVVYGGLAVAYDRLRDPWIVLGVVTLVVAVSLSRVVLGVHYLGDVIVGAILGIAFIVAMNRISRGIPTVGFGLAVVLSAPAVYVTDASPYAVLALGSAIGGLLATCWIDRLPRLHSRLEGVALVAVGGGVALVFLIVESLVTFTPGLVVLYAALVGWIVVAPAVVGRLSTLLFGSTRGGVADGS